MLIPALTITKTASTATATPGSAVGYTITVDDTGQTPYTAATVTDDLDGVLDDAAYNNDATATTGTVSYASPTLTWTGNLAPGDTATITYSVTVNNPDTGGGALSNTVVSTAPGSTCPAGPAAPGCTVTVAVVAGPLSITAPATASLGSAAPGGTVSAGLGTVQVTDDRGFGAGWTATVSATELRHRHRHSRRDHPRRRRPIRHHRARHGHRLSHLHPGTRRPSSAPARSPSSAPPTSPGTPRSPGIPPSR